MNTTRRTFFVKLFALATGFGIATNLKAAPEPPEYTSMAPSSGENIDLYELQHGKLVCGYRIDPATGLLMPVASSAGATGSFLKKQKDKI